MDEKELFKLLKNFAQKFRKSINPSKEKAVLQSMSFLKNKAKTLDDIYCNSEYIIKDNIDILPEDKKLLDPSSKKIISEFLEMFSKIDIPNKENLEEIINNLIKKHKTNFKGVGQPLRIALVGSRFGPGIYNIILSLPKEEVLKRLSKIN